MTRSRLSGVLGNPGPDIERRVIAACTGHAAECLSELVEHILVSERSDTTEETAIRAVTALMAAGLSAEDLNTVTDGRLGLLTILHAAAYKGYPQLAELLLALGARVDARDRDGWTPLHYAVYPSDLYNTYVSEAGEEDIERVVDMLLAHGADINATDRDGWTPLHHVIHVMCNTYSTAAELVASPILRIAIMLVRRGADVEKRDRSGETPLDKAHRFKPLLSTLFDYVLRGSEPRVARAGAGQ